MAGAADTAAEDASTFRDCAAPFIGGLGLAGSICDTATTTHSTEARTPKIPPQIRDASAVRPVRRQCLAEPHHTSTQIEIAAIIRMKLLKLPPYSVGCTVSSVYESPRLACGSRNQRSVATWQCRSQPRIAGGARLASTHSPLNNARHRTRIERHGGQTTQRRGLPTS